MSNWQPGDLALCVGMFYDSSGQPSTKVRRGGIYKVAKVIPAVRWVQGYVGTALALDGIKHRNPCGGFGPQNSAKSPPALTLKALR